MNLTMSAKARVGPATATAPCRAHFAAPAAPAQVATLGRMRRASAMRPVLANAVPPSMQAGANVLASLMEATEVIPDTVLMDDFATYKPTAATVNASIIRSIATSMAHADLEIAVENALSFPACVALNDGTPNKANDKMLNCFLDKALANVGSNFASHVDGKVSVEVDPNLAEDTDAIVKKVKHLLGLFEDMGTKKDKLLWKIPATWAGIQAVAKLEKEGLMCHVTHVYCFVQAAAAAQAGAAVIQPYVGRVRDWYRANPNAIHDPHGPREDAGSLFEENMSDAGIELVKKVWNFVRKQGLGSKVIAASMRNQDDVMALAGVDYMVISPRMMKKMEASATDAGYNDGLRPGGSTGITIPLSKESAAAAEFAEVELKTVDAALFEVELNQCAKDLMAESLAISRKEHSRAMTELDHMYPPTAGGA